MNIPATTDPSTQPDDLVLRFVGGANDGESVSISTECCALGVPKQSAKDGFVSGQCAIYRGPAGVAVQSHSDELLINGEAKSVHWLKRGDKIQVSDSQSVEVVQLGVLANANEAHEVAVVETPTTESAVPGIATFTSADQAPADQAEPVVDFQTTETVDVAGDRIDFVSHAVQDQLADESSAFSEPSSFSQPAESEAAEASLAGPVQGADQRLDALENSVNQLHDQASNVDRRFDRLEDSLNALTEHLEGLAVGNLSSASVDATPSAASSVAFAAQPEQEVVEASIPDAPAETAPLAEQEIVEAPAAFQTPEPAIAAVDDPAPASRGDNYEKSIAALFSELANTDSPESPTAQVAVEPVAETSLYQQGAPQTDGEVDPAVSPVSSPVEMMTTEQTAQETIAPVADQAYSPLAEASESAVAPAATDTDADGSAEQPAGGFTERMLASMHDETPTWSSEEVASVVGLGNGNSEATVEESPVVETPDAIEAAAAVPAVAEVAETTPVLRAEARTESVAEIFARLHSGDPTSEGAAETPVPAAPIRQTVQTTFEDVQASVSAALDADVSAMPETDPGFVHAEQVVDTESAPVEPVAAEDVSAAVETVEPAEPADDVNAVMERLRNSLEAEEDSETTEESHQTGANETQQATDVPVGVRKQQDSVEDYMSMLMSRMNGDSDGSEVSDESDSATEVSSGVSDFNRPQSGAEGGLLEEAVVNTLLTEEEFVPKQKATPIKSLDKMRELANSTSRSAVQRSERAVQIERKKSLILQALALGSLALAVMMIWGKSYIAGGAFAVIFFVTSAYFLYDTVSPSRAKEIAQVKKSTSSRPESESTPSSDED